MVVMDNKLFGKPSDFTEAFSMLSTFSGKKHKVVTGITIIKNGEVITDSDEGTIKLKILTKAQKESRELVLSAKKEAEAERKRIVEKANKQAKEILTGTRKQIERDLKK